MSLANKLRLATRLPMTEKMLAVFSASFVQLAAAGSMVENASSPKNPQASQ